MAASGFMILGEVWSFFKRSSKNSKCSNISSVLFPFSSCNSWRNSTQFFICRQISCTLEESTTVCLMTTKENYIMVLTLMLLFTINYEIMCTLITGLSSMIYFSSLNWLYLLLWWLIIKRSADRGVISTNDDKVPATASPRNEGGWRGERTFLFTGWQRSVYGFPYSKHAIKHH